MELLSATGRAHEAAAAGSQLPSLVRLRGWGFVVDVQALRQADLSGIEEEDDEDDDEEDDDDDEDNEDDDNEDDKYDAEEED